MRGPNLNFELLSGPAGVYAPGPGVWVTVSLACFPRKVHFGDFFWVDKAVSAGIVLASCAPTGSTATRNDSRRKPGEG